MNQPSRYAANRCTALRPTGKLCGLPSAEGAPFPLCRSHAEKAYLYVSERIDKRDEPVPLDMAELRRMRERGRAETDTLAQRRREVAEAQSLVYYVRMHEHIKIGFSTNMLQRLVALRTPAENVLATEPGGRKLEAQRHGEFAAERIGRREDFNPSPRLLAHIASIKEKHGEPVITTWPKVG